MASKSWFTVIQPRADLRENKPLDAAEFAVHLDHVRDGRAPDVYQKPEEFFARTFLTKNLLALTGEVVRRLSGETTATSAVFNMTTQFGGGKTHALTLLYHLAKQGNAARSWPGVDRIITQAGVENIPKADVAVFVGTEFDSIAGRGGTDGTPKRMTPWGEIAFQLGGAAGYAHVAQHDQQKTAPAGDVIRKILPEDRPCLILMDELLNYCNRTRKSGLSDQLYSFLQNLTETVRGRKNVVLAVSLPMSEYEMAVDDQADFDRLKKMLDRVGKPVIMSAETETAEIIRRRLFEWDLSKQTADGRVLLPAEAVDACKEAAKFVLENKANLPGSFAYEQAREQFEATYPFHPAVISVFERKWRELPRFQQTRGVLRLLAVWVSQLYQDATVKLLPDRFITLGTAPLENPNFRTAAFEQLGESSLEGAVTTDIAGSSGSIATRLDAEAKGEIKKQQIHRKAATVVFFESNGGQLQKRATLQEIRFAVAGPEIDMANVETVMEALAPPNGTCHYLDAAGNAYWFSTKPNLVKVLADRKGIINAKDVEETVNKCVLDVMKMTALQGVERVAFPSESKDIPDRAALTFVVMSPEHHQGDGDQTRRLIEQFIAQSGASSRTYKAGLVFIVPESSAALTDTARKLLAWENIEQESAAIKLDEDQKRQVVAHIKKAEIELKEVVWRTYKNLYLLSKDNKLQHKDLGMIHSSAADNLPRYLLSQLQKDDIVTNTISPSFLVRNWPPARDEWDTASVRSMFFASPQFPKILSPDVVKAAIAKGVAEKQFALVGKDANGAYEPISYGEQVGQSEVELITDVFLIKPERVEAFQRAKTDGPSLTTPPSGAMSGDRAATLDSQGPAGGAGSLFQPPAKTVQRLVWQGEIPAQKWSQFYAKVLTRHVTDGGMKLTVTVEIAPPGGISEQKISETRTGLKELGLTDDFEVK